MSQENQPFQPYLEERLLATVDVRQAFLLQVLRLKNLMGGNDSWNIQVVEATV